MFPTTIYGITGTVLNSDQKHTSHSHVGDNVILMTILCCVWWCYGVDVGDRISILMTFLEC